MLQDLTDEAEILRRAFQFFDKDGNGEISVQELRTTMHELGDLLTEEEIVAFMEVMDVNNDGVIGVRAGVLGLGRRGLGHRAGRSDARGGATHETEVTNQGEDRKMTVILIKQDYSERVAITPFPACLVR